MRVKDRVSPESIEAVGDAYGRHYRDVYRYVLALTRSTSDAEEIVGEVFERAIRGGWSIVPSEPLPWLLLVARRIATDRWRRAQRLARVLLAIAPRARAEAGEDHTEFWLWFDQVAGVLTDKQREVLVLRYQRDLSDEDIGRIMRLSASGVRSLVSRALSELRARPEIMS
jgi:RNA polymerase sigma factor (sigma-70 family)